MSDEELYVLQLSGPEIAVAARAVLDHIQRPDRAEWARSLLDMVYGYDDFQTDLEAMLRTIGQSRAQPSETFDGRFTHEAQWFFQVLEEWWKAMNAANEAPLSATLH